MKIYLAGKITGLTNEEAINWRLHTKLSLGEYADCIFMIPENNISEKELWHKCYFLLDQSDLLIVNFDYLPNCPFLGTSMEISRAHAKNKPIIIFSNKDWVHKNETLKHHATKILRTNEEAIQYVKDNYCL